MNANYTTRTAALKTVTHDSNIITTNKLFVNIKTDDGKVEKTNIIDLIKSASTKIFLDDRGNTVTQNDLWGETVESDGTTIKIQNKWLSGNGYCDIHELDNVIASDNKIQDTDKEFSANVQFNKIVDGTNMFSGLSDLSIECNFDNLEIGDNMFINTKLSKDNFDLPSLKHASQMYCEATLPTNVFSKTLDNLISGEQMFERTKNLNYFYSNIPYCCTGYKMFSESGIYEFRGAVTYLYDGRYMFKDTNLKYATSDFSSLVSGVGMFENTSLSKIAVERIAKTIPSLKGETLVATNQTDEEGNSIDELVGLYENGISFNYKFPTWDTENNKIINSSKKLEIHPDEIGIITITWKDPAAISDADALIIEREYFKLMNLKGWTIVTNLRDNENSTQFVRDINGTLSVGTLILGPKASQWTETTIN